MCEYKQWKDEAARTRLAGGELATCMARWQGGRWGNYELLAASRGACKAVPAAGARIKAEADEAASGRAAGHAHLLPRTHACTCALGDVAGAGGASAPDGLGRFKASAGGPLSATRGRGIRAGAASA